MEYRRVIGKWGEEMACAYLRRHGFEVRERNYYSTVGEIDVVASNGGDLYFIEIKTRLGRELANDLAITPSKRRKLDKTIRHYCYHRGITGAGLIMAALVIFPNKAAKTVRFTWAVLR